MPYLCFSITLQLSCAFSLSLTLTLSPFLALILSLGRLLVSVCVLESKMFDHRNKKHIMTEPERTQIEIVAMIQQQQWLQQMRKKETQPSPSSIIGNNYLTLFTKVNYETGSRYLND